VSERPPSSLTNRDIADVFDTVADMLQLKGEIIHRILAYRRAADSIRELPRDIKAVASEGQLESIDNVGETLADKITELLTTGELNFLNRLKTELPESLVSVLRINGVGPKKAMQFYKELNITTVAELEAAAREGKLASLPGMGAKSEKKIIEGIEALARRSNRVRLDIATVTAEGILAELLTLPAALWGSVAGSVRRGRATIGDLDLVIASRDSASIMDKFVNLPNVASIFGHGSTKSSVELLNGINCDLRVIPPENYGAALCYFTGSQAHNIALRALAQEQGYTLNEWAFTAVDGSGKQILCEQEEQVYAQLGLSWIPPELREDRGEIAAARNGKLPRLIEIGDITCDLHMHTTWSDGKLSVREMAETARARGFQHICITDHTQSLGIANGLTVERLLAQREEIRKVDAEMSAAYDFRVFQGVEMEIRADGNLDYPDEVLAELDMVIASLHVGLRQERAVVTSRLLNAIRNPHVDIIGHPRGQLIPDREPADLDMDAVFAAAKETGTVLEINANPHRLDLDDAHAKRAVEMGIKLAIDCDAHAGEEFELLRYGIATARRGWVKPSDVINTWLTDEFIRWLNR
jgi:DNA polymerase (family 10)